ncbi:MAG: SMP-30/gluconolactonase/LRE family protein [Gemmatimonadetes bacterium]|nr:SMP-30/gluconolactonase/LRE family protein [Gemmatimonadota bacterium]
MRTSVALRSLALLLLSIAASATGSRLAAQVERLDPALDALVPADVRLERLVGKLDWCEGPAWRRSGGYLLFSDIPQNTIYRWKEGEGLSVFLRPAGYIRNDPAGVELGTNGLTFDAQDRLVMADHGNRQIARLDEKNFTRVTLADRYQGKRLNSPNDLVIHSNGDIYFTDPPYGLRDLNRNPAKELDFNGVYRLTAAGELILVTRDLTFPNGIALSPDERTLYVAVSDPQHPVIMAYDVAPAGGVSGGRVFFDASPLQRAGKRGVPDGMTVDARGNLFSTGPGGVLVISPQGKHLGTIVTGQTTSNAEFGDDGSSLYLTADMDIIRVRLTTKGIGF